MSTNPYFPIAYQYLEQWFQTDRYRVDAICSLDLTKKANGLLDLAKAYSLGQSLLLHASAPLEGKSAGYAELFELASRFPTEASIKVNIEKAVWEFGQVIGRLFPRERENASLNTNQLSAATKFLWFAGHHRVRIFDRLAYYSLLKKEAGVMSLQKYEKYCAQWQRSFALALPEIQAAIKLLSSSEILNCSFAGQISILTKEDLKAELENLRFAERLYDRALWLHGGFIRANGARRREDWNSAELHYFTLLTQAIKVN